MVPPGSLTFARDGATAPALRDGQADFTPGISERRSGNSRFLSSDLSNTDVMSNGSGAGSAKRTYDAFGRIDTFSGSWTGPSGYGGAYGYQEDGGGLSLLGHRWYDPEVGRFLTRDPAKDGPNRYAYCGNDPIGFADPEGLWGISFHLGGQLILGVISVSVSLDWTIGDHGTGVGATVGHGRAGGAYAGVGFGASYSPSWSPYDPNFAHQNGYATGISTPIGSAEVNDDDGNPFNGGNDGGGISYGPGLGGGGYREK